jgi:hypothetical protein
MSVKGGNMGRLEGSITYLCGPIDNVDDDGVVWRKQIGEILSARYDMKIYQVNSPSHLCGRPSRCRIPDERY